MPPSVEIFLLVLAFSLTLGIAIVTVKGFGLLKISWLNFARLKELEKHKQDAEGPRKTKGVASGDRTLPEFAVQMDSGGARS